MSVNITIHGETADEALDHLRTVAAALLATTTESYMNHAKVLMTPYPEAAAKDVSMSPASTPTPAPAEATSNVPEGAEGVDAHGHPWSADLHASTGSKTKEGLWRMKPGVARPDPLPGFPVETGNTAATGATSTPTSGAAVEQAASATAPNAGASAEDPDDEFAAFRAATAANEANTTAASAPAARKFTDADLAVIANAAAQKLGDPQPVKDLIAQYVGEGAVAHSRNIPEAARQGWVDAIVARTGITV